MQIEKLKHQFGVEEVYSEPIESTSPETPDRVSKSIDEYPENPSSLSPLTPEEEEILAFPPSNQQTLDCDWYQRLINKKRRLTEAQTQDCPQSASTSNQPSTERIIVFSLSLLYFK